MPNRKKKLVEEPKVEEPVQTPPPAFRTDDYNPSKSRVIFITVATFAVILIAVWGWSITEQIQHFPWKQSSEAHIITNAQQTWNNIYKEQTDQENAYVDVKNNLKKLIQSATAAASSTADTAPSTTVTSSISTTISNTVSTTAPTSSKKKK